MSAYQRNIHLYYAYSFIRDFHFIGAVLVIFFTDWGGIPQSKVQILQAWFMIWIFLLEVPTGAIADRFGRKASLFLGAIVGACGFFIYSLAPNFVLFLIAEVMIASAVALASGADEALIYDSLRQTHQSDIEKKAKTVFAHAQILRMIGIGLAGITGGFIADWLGLNYTVRLSAIPLLLAAFISLFFKEPTTRKQQESARYIQVLVKGFKNVVHNKILRSLAIDTALISAFAYFVIWLYQPKLASIGVAIAFFGFFHGFLTLVEIVFLKVLPWIDNRIKHTKIILTVSSLAIGLSFIGAGMSHTVWGIIALLVFAGGLGLTRRTFMAHIVHEHLSSQERATSISFISMMWRFCLIVLNPLVGYMADWSLNGTLIALGGAVVILAVFSPVRRKIVEI